MNDARTVVVVDDDEDSRRICLDVLERRGYLAVAASGGEEGLGIIRRILPAAVVVDYQIPRFDGCELVRALARDPATARIPAILLTADARPEVRERAREAGCAGFLLKPSDPYELTDKIQDLIRPLRPLDRVA